MSEKKQVFLSLETARKMWKYYSDDENEDSPGQLFLLENFTKEELEAKELPKSWEELNPIEVAKGYYINYDSRIIVNAKGFGCHENNKNIFPTKELAEASLALSQLLQLRDRYNGNWKVDLNNRPNEIRYTISNVYNNITKDYCKSGGNLILSFQKESIRDQFIENFSELINQALPLL